MFASFMTNTWIVATIIAIVAGCVGFFVVLRGATFAAHALPLGTFPGAAAASLLGINPLWGLFVFAGLGVAGIGRLARRQRNDVATALVLIALLGFGTLCLSLSGHYEQSVYGLLFGEVLGIGAADIPPVAGVSFLVILMLGLCFRPLLLTSVSADLGAARGVSASMIDRLFLGLLATATAMALPVVGALLVFSLMVGPAAAARLCTSRPIAAMAVSVALALGIVWSAIALSYWTDWPIGFFVGAFAASAYGAARGWRWARRWTALRSVHVTVIGA
ncbi:MAG: metal ABC transporter permease [Proteobacteria bacterium]|nr:metal ABC transporter permease [Pseudomonadota bacterium]